MKEIKRDLYLEKLINRQENGLIKIVTGIRRCGKSYLLDPIYKDYLLRNGVKEDHIIKIDLDERSKDLAKRIFLRVAKAEAKVHNKPLEEVHFHEVGAIDSIVDIVGTAILINKINPDRIISSIVNGGYGFIECAHGIHQYL